MSCLAPKIIVWKKKKTCFIADETSRGLGIRRKIMQKKKNVPTVSSQGAPSFRKHFFQSKSATSIVARFPTLLCVDAC